MVWVPAPVLARSRKGRLKVMQLKERPMSLSEKRLRRRRRLVLLKNEKKRG
jgi:hypothetical protein